MQLKSLWIKDYKNLKDLQLDFQQGNGLSILIGNNGSGKSNVIEAISGIFADWHNTPSGIFGTDYRIEYELDGENIVLESTDYKRYVNGVAFKKNLNMNLYLPSNVIALYSGEDLRLYENFYKTKCSHSLKNAFKKGYMGKMGMYYVNKDLWNISLLTLILFMNDFPDVKHFLSTELDIKDDNSIKQIDILMQDLNEKNYNKTKNLTVKAFIDKITPNGRSVVNPYFVTELRNLISNSSDNFDVEPAEVFNLLMQACMPKKYQIITGIEITFNNGLKLESLSEGEKKLILIKAILEFVADENSLLLLDEPDANIHEARKRKLYDLLRNTINRNVVMTTHSPTFIDISDEDEIVVLKCDSSGRTFIYDIDNMEKMRYLTGDRINIFSNRPILYCEGTETSVESVLYPLLFPGYNIIPAGGHEEVIRLTKTYNKTFGNDNHYAIGIIDWDYKTPEELSALKEEKIYSLKVVEIENVLMDLTLLNVAKERFCSDDDCVEKVKQYLFDDCNKRKDYQAAKYTANNIVSQVKSGLSPDGKIEDFKSRINELCDVKKIDELYKERLEYLENCLQKELFDELVEIYDFGHKIDRFVKDNIVDGYQNRILRLIQKSEDLQKFLKQKYYPDIEERH